uniref:Tnfrsf10b n=1 Tax=Mus terricolor TaxID=254704 RepID=H9BPI4_MUSTR|nr:Tnfrsf10b [Mus terricolor]
MESPGPSTPTASAAARADHYTPGLRPLPKRRLLYSFALLAMLQVVFVPVTANSAHDRPSGLQSLKESPSGGPCPAGQYLSEGNCKPCTEGIDYTSHSNSLLSCLPCTVCKEDKVQTFQCNLTRNTECQCKPGTFEDKDSTEICQPCSNCTDGEDEVTPCTPKTNRKCVSKKAGASLHDSGLKIGLPVAAVLLLLFGAWSVWKTGAWRRWLLFIKRTYPGCERDPESVNSVHSSLLDPQTSSKTNDSNHNTEPGKTQSSTTGKKLLVPANGNDSADDLKFIFEYCSNIVPLNSWNRLMRQMGLTDNQIQMVRAETPGIREAHYQMLLKWRHQTGRKASINDLLDALEAVGERDAMEKIEDYAVKNGRFTYQNAAAQPETGPGGSLCV